MEQDKSAPRTDDQYFKSIVKIGDTTENSLAEDGIYFLLGNTKVIDRWEYWLALSRVLCVQKSILPQGATIDECAMISMVDIAKVKACKGMIVVVAEKSDNEPFLAFTDYNLVMQAFNSKGESGVVYTTVPLCPKEKVVERTVLLDCLDPEGPKELYEFTWQDFRDRFKKKKAERVVTPVAQIAPSNGLDPLA